MRASRKWDDKRVLPPAHVEERYGVTVKPCPFCNFPHIGLYLGPSPHMTCSNCGADGPTFDGSKETIEQRQHDAVKAWNGSMPRNPVFNPRAI